MPTLSIHVRHPGVPAPLLFAVGGASLYFGAALAVLLFDRLDPAAVAWLRMVTAALVLLAWRRPRRPVWRGKRLGRAGCFGLVTGLMNVAFYEAIARLALGTAVAVEFCGPVVIAAWGSRRRRDLAALLLAVGGVVLIAEVQLAGRSAGLALALLAAVMWAVYIVLGKRIAGGGSGLDDMAVGFTVAAVLLAPLALGTGPVWRSPTLLMLAAGAGVLSTVVPYTLDQVVLRRMGQARFALLLSLLPATASAVGLVVLGQVPRPLEAAGILAVVAAVALRSRDVEYGSTPAASSSRIKAGQERSSGSESPGSPPPATRSPPADGSAPWR